MSSSYTCTFQIIPNLKGLEGKNKLRIVPISKGTRAAADPGNTITLSSIRNVVKQAMNTNGIDRSKNVVIFGLNEVKEENTVKATEKVLESINLKPKITSAIRFGRLQDDKTRPIRVTFEKSEAVHDVLKSSKSLKTNHEFSRVYISVDRSKEQQARHRELVKTLRKLISEQPEKHWYIQNNEIKCNMSST